MRQHNHQKPTAMAMCVHRLFHRPIKTDPDILHLQGLWVNYTRDWRHCAQHGSGRGNNPATSLKVRVSVINFIKISCQIAFGSAEHAAVHTSSPSSTEVLIFSFSLPSQTHTQMLKPPLTTKQTQTHTLRPPGRSVYGIRQRPHEKQTLVDQTLFFGHKRPKKRKEKKKASFIQFRHGVPPFGNKDFKDFLWSQTKICCYKQSQTRTVLKTEAMGL